jgi:hypothetical protein
VNLWIPGLFYGFAVTVKRIPVLSFPEIFADTKK